VPGAGTGPHGRVTGDGGGQPGHAGQPAGAGLAGRGWLSPGRRCRPGRVP